MNANSDLVGVGLYTIADAARLAEALLAVPHRWTPAPIRPFRAR